MLKSWTHCREGKGGRQPRADRTLLADAHAIGYNRGSTRTNPIEI